jgi:hypothetical protein
MDIEELPANVRFAFLTMSQLACNLKLEGHDKDFFVSFAGEIWDSMLLTGAKELQEIILEYMQQDIVKMTKGKI